jgi:hypothetical protein
LEGFHSTLDPGARHQLVPGVTGQTAVVFHGGHTEEHVAVGLVGVVLGDQGLDERDHAGDVLGRPGLEGWRQSAQLGHVLVIDLGGAAGERVDLLAVF